MDKIDEYRRYIKDLLSEIGSYKGLSETVYSQLIFDTVSDRYQLMRLGWENKKRVYGCIIQLDIIDGKVWLQHNSTDIDVAKRLVEIGIPNSDIVLGFQPVYIRQFTEYAVG